jgi:hypothetical protein
MAKRDLVAASVSDLAADTGWTEPLGTVWLALRVAALSLWLPLRLRGTPAVRVAARLAPRRANTGRRRQRPLAAAVWLADRLVNRMPWQYGGHCVRRSLLLYYAATRCGCPVTVVFGVRREGTELAGHAWLELDGQPFLERLAEPHVAYLEMQRWPPAAPLATAPRP